MGQVEYDHIGYVVETATGVRCGAHGGRVYHANAASVRECYRIDAELREQAEADYKHDRYVERLLETRYDDGYAGSMEEARDRWLESLREEAELEAAAA